jgi:hypothetical protein
MILNTAAFFTLGAFEAGWALFLNFFIWSYTTRNFKDFTLSWAHLYQALLALILLIGYIHIVIYDFIILAALLVVVGGYFTGY